MSANRGVVRNYAYASQVRDFSGLRYGNITPTDIDMAMEFGGRVFIFCEIKYGDTPMGVGQRLWFERVVDLLQQHETVSLGICATHNSPPETNIDVAICRATSIRFNGKWMTTDGTVREIIDRFLEKYAPEFLT